MAVASVNKQVLSNKKNFSTPLGELFSDFSWSDLAYLHTATKRCYHHAALQVPVAAERAMPWRTHVLLLMPKVGYIFFK